MMDCKLPDLDKLDPADTFHVCCPECEEHTFTVYVETLQLMKGMTIKCPKCGKLVDIYVNPVGILCIE